MEKEHASPKVTSFEEPAAATQTALHQPPRANGSPGMIRRSTRTGTADTARLSQFSPNPNHSRSGTGPRRTMSLRRVATSLMQPERKVGKPPGVWQGIRSIITTSYLNVLLVFIPISWAFHWAKPESYTLIFIFSFLAIIPLAKLLGFATEELSLRTGQTIAGLLNATLGNAVELIVAIIALAKCELQIVQSSLIGSILSNLLLVLGMCFFVGGTRYSEQGFGISAAQINSTLLTISVIAILLPAAFNFSVASGTTADDPDLDQDILSLSHGVGIILLLLYGAYLTFQLWSHAHLYEEKDNPEVAESKRYPPKAKKEPANITGQEQVQSPTAEVPGSAPTSATVIGHADPEVAAAAHEEDEEDEETPQMSLWMAIILLAVITVLVAVTSEFLVDSIDGLTESGHISKEFVGLILLPIVGNAAEHVTAVTVAYKDKLTLSIGVAVGSSIQIALFVIPFIVTLGWIMGRPLTFLFDPFESIVLFLSVITVNYVVADGKSNWLEGVLLTTLYIILALIFWYYPGSDPDKVLSGLQCHHS